jgi:peptidyl-prolyl cis-trans isomerase SurA
MKAFLQRSLEGLAVFGTICVALAFSSGAWADVVDRVAAKVNEDIITLSQVRERAEIQLGRLKAARVTEVPSDEELLKLSMEELIDERLQLQDGKKNQISVDNQSVLKALEDIKKRNNITQEELEGMLESEGRTLDQYRDTLREQILLSKIVRFQMGDPGKVSEKAVQAYYKEHLADYWRPPTPHVSHILFILDDLMDEEEKTVKRQKAREVLEQIRTGEDFEELAKQYSEDVSGRTGGSIGPVTLGNLVAEFEKAAFSLKEGEISDLVETKYGLHIIRVDKREPGETRPLAEVRPGIEKILGREAHAAAYDKWMNELKKKSFIETYLFEDAEQVEEEPSHADAPAGVSETARQQVRKAPAPAADLEVVEAQLSRIKKLYASKRISESEYQKRKRELLDRL